MITKSYIAEQILLKVHKGDNPSFASIEQQDCFPLIAQCLNYYVSKYDEEKKDARLRGLKEPDIDTGFMTVFDNVPVLNDTVKNLKYIVVPSPYLTMLDNIGLYWISPEQGANEKFTLVTPDYVSMYSQTPGFKYGRVCYWAETINGEQRAYFSNRFDGTEYRCTSVLVKLIQDIIAVDEDAPIYFPTQLQWPVINAVAEYLMDEKKSIVDRLNDNFPS
jgi:hypothetical protein